MEYLRHPRRLREFLFALVPFGLTVAAVVVYRQTGDSWPKVNFAANWIGVATLAWFLYLLVFRSNITHCPRCGKKLTRPRRTTDFVCDDCQVTWLCKDRTN